MRRTRATTSALTTPPTSGPSNNLCFIRLLAFVSVIGSQFHVLSSASSGPTTASMASATATAKTTVTATETIVSTTRTNLDAFNTTRAILTTDAQEVSTALFPFSFATKTQSNTQSPTFGSFTYSQSAALKNSKTSIKMHSNIESDSDSIGGKGISKSTTTSSKSIANILVGSLGPPSDSITTTASALKTERSTGKLSTDIATFSKNHWSAATAPYSSLSSSTSVPSASSSSVSFSDTERLRTFRRKHHHEHHWGPFFEEPLNSATSGDNLVSTAHLFTEAVLNCRVGMLKDKTVMWVRRTTEKVSLLTVGNVTYSGDPRIRVKFQYPNNWRLLINPTRKEDAGIYMCQVSTHPPRVFTTNLTILEPPLRLIDEQDREVGDRYYKSGSTVDLQCQVSRSFLQKEKLSIFKSMQSQNVPKTHTNKLNAMESGPNELLFAISANQTMLKLANQELEKQFTNFITWSKDDAFLPVSTVRRSSVTDKWLSSRISIPDAKLSDSGNYSCSLGKLFTVIVQVQVLTGELPAAVQHNAASNKEPSSLVWQWICFIMPILFVISQNISTSLAI